MHMYMPHIFAQRFAEWHDKSEARNALQRTIACSNHKPPAMTDLM